MFTNPGRVLILLGMVFIVLGLIFILGAKIPWLGRLPGDIYFQRKNVNFYFPLASSMLISIILSFLLWVFSRR